MLRLRAAVATALVVALVIAAPVSAAHVKQDLAWGSGVLAPLTTGSTAPSFQFNSSSDPDGANPGGTFIYTTATGGFVATVTCLRVVGKQATMVGQINTATGTFVGVEGWWFVTVAQDNGTATKRHPSPDTMSRVGYNSEAGWNGALAGACADPFSALEDPTMYPLVAGDFTVIDR